MLAQEGSTIDLATRIRLKRTGKKNRASYRIVVMDRRKPRDGEAVEELGFYDPMTDPVTISVNEERAEYWLSVGAQPSETVKRLLVSAGVLDADDVPDFGAEDAEEAEAAAGEDAGEEEPASDDEAADFVQADAADEAAQGNAEEGDDQ
jgi:small subunit ribosomal protein S16